MAIARLDFLLVRHVAFSPGSQRTPVDRATRFLDFDFPKKEKNMIALLRSQKRRHRPLVTILSPCVSSLPVSRHADVRGKGGVT